ncbi:MAG TPA: hypothetical protein VEW46_13650 [Pyrinomonadaceae bacterium]|nr:hypothetical protein [Pyrinomonadaceae bacterium]
MARIQTVISDRSWGEIAQFSVEGESEVEAGIRHIFRPSTSQSHVIVVVAEAPDQIRQVMVNGEEARRIDTGSAVTFVSQVGPLEPNVEVDILLNREVSSATVHAGFFAKWGKKLRGMFHSAVSKFANECFVCQSLLRMGISLATGGADLAGEALETALEAAESALDEFISDTLLGEILDVLRNVVNPGRLVAREVCRELGYCT